MNYKVIELPTRGDINTGMGALSFAEQGEYIPFEVKRMYCIYGVQDGVQRGGHAHKKTVRC